MGHISELRKVQLSQAMRRARAQLQERLEMSKMTASQLDPWQQGKLGALGTGDGGFGLA